MTFKVIPGQGQGEEMTSFPYRDYFLGDLLRDDLISPVKMSVHEYVRLSVRPYIHNET